MSLPSLSNLVLPVEARRKRQDDIEPYRNVGPSLKRTLEVPEIEVRSVRLLPRPPDAIPAYTLFHTVLENFAEFIFSTAEPYMDDLFEESLEQWVRSKMTLKKGVLDYNSSLLFLGHYIAISIMGINASGPPDAMWGGPITDPERYPVGRAIEIWNAIVESHRYEAIKRMLNRVCPGKPRHPWYDVNDNLKRIGTFTSIDTMGGIIDMTMEHGPTLTRDLLIATRNDEFMGHVFVSYANQPYKTIRGLMPYGIQRSVFYLPGTCTHPIDATGFVDALFGRINKIADDNYITHIFTWPLEKMKQRFVSMGYDVVTKQTQTGVKLDELKLAVYSIYGAESVTTDYILNRELQNWDFVLRTL